MKTVDIWGTAEAQKVICKWRTPSHLVYHCALKNENIALCLYRELIIYIQIHKLIWVWLKQNSLNNTKWQQMLNWSYHVVMNDAWMKIDLE